MKIAIFYESKTGNTKCVAKAIQEACKEQVIYCGSPKDVEADLYFIGSWTDKGSCTQNIKESLSNLKNKPIAYFGTCGFGGSASYFESLYQRILPLIDPSCTILGHFFCPGKMPVSVKESWEKLQKQTPDDPMWDVRMHNFEQVKDRPNADDLENAKKWAEEMIQEVNK